MSVRERLSQIIGIIWAGFSAWLGFQWMDELISIEIFLALVVIAGFLALYLISKIENM